MHFLDYAKIKNCNLGPMPKLNSSTDELGTYGKLDMKKLKLYDDLV